MNLVDVDKLSIDGLFQLLETVLTKINTILFLGNLSDDCQINIKIKRNNLLGDDENV